MTDLEQIYNDLQNKNNFQNEFLLKTGNTTEINHLIFASYYADWTDIKLKQKKKRNKKSPREMSIKLSNRDNGIKLQNFMSRKFIITQGLEDLFTKYPISGHKYNTEKIGFLSKIQRHIHKNNISFFYYHSTHNKDIIYNKVCKINEHEKKHINKELDDFYNKKLECKLYLDFFKTRMSLWEFSEEISSNTTINILKIITSVINKNVYGMELLYYKHTINIILQYLNTHMLIEKFNKNEISQSEYDNKIKIKDYLINTHNSTNLVYERDKITDILNNIILFLEKNSFEDSLYSVNINSAFFLDFLTTVRLFSLKNNYLIISSDKKLTTGESPMVYLKLDQIQTKDIITNLINNHTISNTYVSYSDETEIYLIPYSANILIIEADQWYLDYMLHYIKNNKQKIIIDFYEKHKKTHNENNNYQILVE